VVVLPNCFTHNARQTRSGPPVMMISTDVKHRLKPAGVVRIAGTAMECRYHLIIGVEVHCANFVNWRFSLRLRRGPTAPQLIIPGVRRSLLTCSASPPSGNRRPSVPRQHQCQCVSSLVDNADNNLKAAAGVHPPNHRRRVTQQQPDVQRRARTT
jgi:hypothetical protein